MEKKLTNSSPFRESVDKHSIYTQTQRFLAALLQELAERTTAQTAERLEAARQAAQQERARKRVLRQGQGDPYPGVRNIFDGHAPIKQYVARQR
jgi:hypothetical protein